MAHELAATLQNNLDSYAAFAAQVAGFHERCAMPRHMAYAADLALEELLTNIIKYGYDDDRTHEISVLLHLDEEGLYIRLEDDGHPFDPTATPEPDLSLPPEERPIGGLGLSLVRKNFHLFQYQRVADHNRTELRMKDKAN